MTSGAVVVYRPGSSRAGLSLSTDMIFGQSLMEIVKVLLPADNDPIGAPIRWNVGGSMPINAKKHILSCLEGGCRSGVCWRGCIMMGVRHHRRGVHRGLW